MTENAESSGASDLPPLPGFGSDVDSNAAPFGDAEPEILAPPSKRFARGADAQAAEPGILPPSLMDDDDEDFEPGISPPKTEARAAKSKERDEFLGRTFGGYELVETIGHGGMGTVYKGRQVSLDRTVAVKLLLPALVNNEEFIRRFEREAKSIARLSHPNIVAVLDFGVSDDGVYYMVIEYVQGTSLSAMIADKLMMSFEEYLPVVSQCLAGLDHVSRHGVIHRDIKPDNILVDETGIAKLADFGLAKDVSEDSNETDLTAVGSAMGTPAYMSPEQCMGRPLDVRSDIYAFGVTSYLALTGEKPFKGNSGFEVMTKQREYVPPAPRELNPQIHQKVSDLIMRMLEKKAQDRFRDADECRQAWLQIGEELGVLIPSNMRSGEWHAHDGMSDAAIPVPVDPNIASIPTDVPQPVQVDMGLPPMQGESEDPFANADRGAPMSAAPGIVPSDRQVASQSVRRAPTAPIPANAPPPPPPPPPSMNQAPPAPPQANNQPGVSSDFRRSHSDSFDASEMRTCSQCGTQSRISYSRCQNCGYDFSLDSVGSLDEQLKRADGLVKQGKLKEAMTLFNKLADQTDDRKLRSVIRSKERGARKAFEDKIYDRVSKQSQELAAQGDIKGSIGVLEREIGSADSSELSTRLANQVDSLKSTLKKKKRRRRSVLFVLCVIAGVAAAAFVYREHIPFLNEFLKPYLEQMSADADGPATSSVAPSVEVEADAVVEDDAASTGAVE